MKKLYPGLLFFFCFLFGPADLGAQLRPVSAESHREMGREYVDLSGEGLRLELGFDGYFDGRMVFDLVIVNEGPDTCRIDPSAFYYVLLTEPEADSSRFPPRMALHPERVLNSYNDQVEESLADKSLNFVFGVLQTGVGIIASTSASIAQGDDPFFAVDAVLGTVESAAQFLLNDARISADMEAIEAEQGIVAKEIFRPTSIPPGKAKSGFVFFPPEDDPMYYMFCFPVGDQEFQFVYMPPNLQACNAY
ncbi:MAG: hypothetical protein CSA96_02640 [Bacteroidetes bacterium]|nr:MAG: hypothetical protein CSA96_02640 [Bacteroidota bacterium]